MQDFDLDEIPMVSLNITCIRMWSTGGTFKEILVIISITHSSVSTGHCSITAA